MNLRSPQWRRTSRTILPWDKTVAAALACLAIGVGGFLLAAYLAWDDVRNKGGLDANAVTGLSIVGIGAGMFCTFGVIILPIGLRERRQQQTIRATTMAEAEVAPVWDGWIPATGVTGHDGQNLPIDNDYFVAPPGEIGPVVSAFTSLRKGVVSRGSSWCLFVALAWGTAGFGLGWLLMSLLFPKDPSAPPCGGAFLACLGALFGWAQARFWHACTYVGKCGVARFECAGQRSRLVRREIFLFQEASNLRTAVTRHYRNGMYQKTTFHFDWRDSEGAMRYQMTGMFGHPHRLEDWAHAAEVAWHSHMAEHVANELRQRNCVSFELDGADWIALGPGYLEFHHRDATIRCTRDEIQSLELSEGLFTLRLQEREGIPGSGNVHKFSYAAVANVMAFLLLLDQLLDMRIQSAAGSSTDWMIGSQARANS